MQNVEILDLASNWFGCVFSKSLCIRSLILQIVMKRQFRGEASWKVTMASGCCSQEGLGVVLLKPGLLLKGVDYDFKKKKAKHADPILWWVRVVSV